VIGLPGGIRDGGEDVVKLEERIIPKDFFVGSPGTQKLQDICHPDSLSANARLPAALAGFDGDSG